jgi:hypothetical protein
MKSFHRTAAADKILSDGFRNGSGRYLTDEQHEGVWLADRTLDEDPGAGAYTVLAVEVPESVVSDYEWVEDGKSYREFLVPADLLNQFGPPIVYEADYAGMTREKVMAIVTSLAEHGNHDQASRLRAHVEVLEKLNLLKE